MGQVNRMNKRPALDEINSIRHLMVGDWQDKAQAARLLKEYDPDQLPIDILEVWEGADDVGTRYLALQVEAGWFSRRHGGLLVAAWMFFALAGLLFPPLFMHLMKRGAGIKKNGKTRQPEDVI